MCIILSVYKCKIYCKTASRLLILNSLVSFAVITPPSIDYTHPTKKKSHFVTIWTKGFKAARNNSHMETYMTLFIARIPDDIEVGMCTLF